MNPELSRLYFMTTTWFGPGAVARLPQTLAELGIRRPFLVADRGLVAAGVVEGALATMTPAPVATYLNTPPNPTVDACRAAALMFRESGADGIVALGGGSPIDLGKAVALLGTHAGDLSRFDVTQPGGSDAISRDCAPLVAIPTTAGTGSEVGRAAVITTSEDTKLILLSPNLLPRVTLADPCLAVSLPPALTAGAGMDAFTHCIEGFLAPNHNPPAQAVALDGLKRIWHAIERAFADGSDIAARAALTMGSLEGGMAMANGLGAVHAMSHAAGGLSALRLHHGTLNAVLLPMVLRHNIADPAVDALPLAAALGLARATDLPDAIEALNARLGFPASLRAMGVPADMAGVLSDKAAHDFTSRTNCRPMDRAAYRQLFEKALT